MSACIPPVQPDEIPPESAEILEALGERFKLIAVTNGNANLESIGIRHLFDNVLTAAMAGAAKPAPEVFDMAVQMGGASKAETLHVGDHPLYDVDGARAAGLRTAWVNRTAIVWPDQYAVPEIEVSHIGELPGLLGID